MKLAILTALGIVAGLSTVHDGVLAQGTAYPTKPITLVVPFPPGGGTDTISRPLASLAQKHLGQPMVVINKGGGGGAVGSQFVANAKPDGYTVLYAINNLTENPQIDELLGRPVNFRKEQFIPIGRVTVSPFAIMVEAESRFKTFDDFIDEARQKPDQLQYASAGVYSPTHVMWEMIFKATGVRVRQLPTTGGGPVMTAVLGKHVDIGHCVVPAVCAPQFEAKKIRILAVTSDVRVPSHPDVPTVKELGYDAVYSIWHALMVPAGTPPEFVAKLRQGIKAMVEDATFSELIGKLGERPQYLSGEDFARFWDEDYRKVGALLKEIIKK